MKFIQITIFMVAGFFLSSCQITEKQEPLVTTNNVVFTPKDFYPKFSWDTVPTYMMFADNDRLLKDSEIEKISSETDFICIEKNHGLSTLGDAVLGLEEENKRFKEKKADTVVLGYLNGALTYPFTRYTKMLTAEKIDQYPQMKSYLVKDPKTDDLAKTRGLYGYNVLNPEMRKWWSDSAADMVEVSGADGIFIDQMHGFSWLHPKEKRGQVVDGVADMMAQLKQKIGPDKILLANNGAHIEKVFAVSDAFMFEHYKRKVTHSKEQLLRDWQLMEKIADAGKICIYRFGASPDKDSPLAEAKNKSKKHDDFVALSKQQIELYLSFYLIGAQPYSYFQWNWGWKLSTGPLVHYPELHKPLGKPLGKYKRTYADKWEFTREFEYASVWVDTDKYKAKITWK